MSRYLRYVTLDRAKVPEPGKVVLLQHQLEWANRQVAGEIGAAFKSAELTISPEVCALDFDLLVLPYMDDFLREQPGGVELFRRLRSAQDRWVMLYGLRHRKIDVLPATRLMHYYTLCRRISLAVRIIRRLRLAGIILRLLGLWARR